MAVMPWHRYVMEEREFVNLKAACMSMYANPVNFVSFNTG